MKNIDGQPRTLSNGCYLIRHGKEYMLWDAGLEDRLIGKPEISETQTLSLDKSIGTQLAEIGIKPRQIGRIGISHHHGDHIGQAERFPAATLMIGTEDWAAVKGDRGEAGLVTPWIDGNLPVVLVDGDHDVFGDGRVSVVATPEHTLGHKSLLVRLASGAILLSGDAVHAHDQLRTRRPSGNHVDKVRGVQSIDRMLRIEREAPARTIVQHDREDVDDLPVFPDSLK